MNLNTLNTIIAMVIVLLVLSLLVQTLQTFTKKLFKLKSKQIVGSLTDLYEQAISNVSAPPAGGAADGAKKNPAQEFTDQVVDEFKKIGRVTMWGRPILDSLSKEDLLKVMAKLESENFFPDYVERVQVLCNEIFELKTALETLASNPLLTGATSAKLAQIREVLAPIFNDIQCLLDKDNKVKPKALFGDLLKLMGFKLTDVIELLNEAQQAITHEMEVASKTTPPGSVEGLKALSDELTKLAVRLGNLSQNFDTAIAPLRAKLEQVETWFDTVMQSFDERYSRHMRTVALIISIIVVILLNANFFRIYRSLSTNPVQTDLMVQNGQKVLDLANKANEQPTPSPSPASSPSPTPTPTPLRAATATSPPLPTPSPSPTPSPTPTPTPPVDIKKEAERAKQDIDVYLNTYEEFGFAPLNAQQVRSWLWSIWGSTQLRDGKGNFVTENNKPIASDCREQDEKGKPVLGKDGKQVDCTPGWRPLTWPEWWASRGHDINVLFGWAIMVMLLSAGAPFWQDTLESLFGIKNLLRQKTGTRNVEKESGEGQPKQ